MAMTQSERSKRWRLNNPEKAKERDLRSRKKRTKEKQREYDARNYTKHRETILQHKKEYHSVNTIIINEKKKQRRLANLVKFKEKDIIYHMKNKEKRNEYSKVYHLKYCYGLTLEDYNRIHDTQNGCCAICGKHETKLNKRLVVDHCHKTGKVRGLLCEKCNHGLGRFEDNLTIIENAITYLKSTT